MLYLSHVLTFFIFFIVGLLLGGRTFKYTNKAYDYTLLILAILSLKIGKNAYLLKIFDFEVIVATVVTAVFLGILIRRFNKKYTLIQKFN